MQKKEKIAITIDKQILAQIDNKVDKINFKNRSHVIENFLREWLRLKADIGVIILAHDSNWDDALYPFEYHKSLIQVDGKTLIEKHIENIISIGIKTITLSVSSPDIEIFLKNKYEGIKIDFYYTTHSIGNHSVIDSIQKKMKASKLLILLADNYFHDLQMLDFLHYHNMWGQEVSLVIKIQEKTKWYGNIKMQWNSIIKFVEKPEKKDDISFIVNAWVYIINTNILPEMTSDDKIEKWFFSDYAPSGKMSWYFHNGAWFHVQSDKVLQELAIVT